jgi:NADH:ubiquinone oxidoreductase subunit 6 (subunit J)
VGAIAAIVLVLLMLLSIVQTAWPLAVDQVIPQSTRDLAASLFDEYLFAFEVVGVLLLAGVIGGLYLAHKDPAMPSTNIAGGPGIEEGDGV